MITNNPWDKLPQESHKAYMAFCTYRDLGPYRSLEKTRVKLGQNKHYKKWLEKWSIKFNYSERAKAYDLYLEEKERKVFEDQLIRNRLEHQKAELEEAKKLKTYIDRLFKSALNTPLETVVKEVYIRDEQGNISKTVKVTQKPHEILSSIHTKIEEFSKLGRRALGMPLDSKLEHYLNGESSIEKLARMQQQEELDYSNLSTKELKQLKELMEKLKKPKEGNIISLAS